MATSGRRGRDGAAQPLRDGRVRARHRDGRVGRGEAVHEGGLRLSEPGREVDGRLKGEEEEEDAGESKSVCFSSPPLCRSVSTWFSLGFSSLR